MSEMIIIAGLLLYAPELTETGFGDLWPEVVIDDPRDEA